MLPDCVDLTFHDRSSVESPSPSPELCSRLQQSGDYQDCWLDLTKTDQISIGAWCTSNFWLWPGNNIFGCMQVPPKLPSVLFQLMLPLLEHGTLSKPRSSDVRSAVRVPRGRRQPAHCRCHAMDPDPDPDPE